MVLLTYGHGLRAAEVVDLRWEQVDFKTASLHVRRVKNGTPSTHPLTGRELRELRRHQRESAKSPFVFVSERGAPLSAPGFSRMIERAGVAADLGIKAHAYMLRHACGFKLANNGIDTRALQVYLGHRNIQNTDPVHGAGARSVQGLLALVSELIKRLRSDRLSVVNSRHGPAILLYPPGGGDDAVPRYFFIVAYPDREFDDPDGTLLPGDEAAIDYARRLAEELREDRQPGEPDMTMIVKNVDGVVIYSAPV